MGERKPWDEFYMKTHCCRMKIDSKKIREIIYENEESQYGILNENLKKLENYYNNNEQAKVGFYNAFELAILEMYFKGLKNKSKQWSLVLSGIEILGGALFSGGILAIISSIIDKIITKLLIEKSIGIISNIPLSVLVIVCGIGAFLYINIKLIQKRAYKQTWVRHASAFHKMNIAMVKFLYTTKQTDADRQAFEDCIFDIWSANLSTFTLNMNSDTVPNDEGR